MRDVKFDYKDIETLKQYLDARGRIKSRKETKLELPQQNELASAVKKTRQIALL